jgi:hypothetical protein
VSQSLFPKIMHASSRPWAVHARSIAEAPSMRTR